MNNGVDDNKRSFNRKKLIVPIFFVFAILVIVGVSYALWQLTFTQSGTNVITTGCLKLTLTEDTDAINLVDATPTSDEEGKKLEPFTFTLENICTTETKYVVNLETLSSGDKILADNYVKANLVSGENEFFIDNLLETHINEEKVIEEATTAYKLHQGKLGNKEKISFNLRLWMDEATEAVDEVMNASWQGKITVTASYIPVSATTRMMISPIYSTEWIVGDYYWHGGSETYTNNFKYHLSRIVFQKEKSVHANAVSVADFSVDKDESVLGYWVKDENDSGLYTLYIESDSKIKMNTNTVDFFYYAFNYSNSDYDKVINLEGLENIDTSHIVKMNNLFHKDSDGSVYRATTSIDGFDFGSWDISNVVDMSGMFYDYNGTSLNLNNLDMSKVMDVSNMFSHCSSLTTTINITNPNIENYKNMFWYAATEEGSQITVNYTAETSDLVDRMIATKSENSNVVKGSLIS